MLLINTIIFQENFIDINNCQVEQEEEEEHDRGKKLKRNAETEESGEEAREKPRAKKRFELPAGYTTIKKESKSKSWKEYLGPDGIHQRVAVETKDLF